MNGKVAWLCGPSAADPKDVFCNAENNPVKRETFPVQLKERLEEAGYAIRLTKTAAVSGPCDALICFDVNQVVWNNVASQPRERCMFLAFLSHRECPQYYSEVLPAQFGHIFVLMDKYVDNVTYFKMHFPFFRAVHTRLSTDQRIDFSQRKLFCMINRNKKLQPHYNQLELPPSFFPDAFETENERANVVASFASTGEFDLYGDNWLGTRHWRGNAHPDKSLTLNNYKFTICYENTWNRRGYLTDRIFAPLLSGCVPVYLGAPDVANYIPKECFIDRRDFASNQDLYQFLKAMDRATYLRYVEAGQHYLDHDPRLKLFSNEPLIQNMLQRLACV